MNKLEKILIALLLVFTTIFVVSYLKMSYQLKVNQLDLGECRWSEWHYMKGGE